MFWNKNAIRTANLPVHLLVFAIGFALCFVAVAAKAGSSSRRLDAHRHYVEGYRQGRADAMVDQPLRTHSQLVLPADEFAEEYQRGYRDGYKLVRY